MKKQISILLALIMALSVCFGMDFCPHAAFSDEINDVDFAEYIGEMVEKSSYKSNIGFADKRFQNGNSYSEFETCRLIVKSDKSINTLNAVSFVHGGDGLWVLQFDCPESTAKAYNYYSKLKTVKYVEPDKYLTVSAVAEKEEKEYLSWGPEYIGLDRLNSDIISSEKQLAGITVAVIDSGVNKNHEILRGRVIDTYINTSGSGTRNSTDDDFGHGTHVAGIIADSTLESVSIKPYKVVDEHGQGTVVTVAAGINCAINDGVDIINISLGFYEDSELLHDAVKKAIAHDITVVASAGNNSTDEPYYPSSYDGVLRITAINQAGNVANFSNIGSGVDFAAPGVKIKTANMNGGYSTVDGTSFAAPFVSALAATIKSVIPLSSSEDIYNRLCYQALKPIYYCSDEEIGNGIINAPEYESENKDGKTSTPVFASNYAHIVVEPIDIEISCETPNSVIYYTTDKSMPSVLNENAKIYTEPIHIDESCYILAAAYSDGKYKSSINGLHITVAPDIPENELSISPDGIITEYRGNEESVSIPETVNSIRVTGIGNEVFKNKDITDIVLSYGTESLGNEAFCGCSKLINVYAKNIKKIGDNCFKDCVNLNNIYIDELSEIGIGAFENAGKTAYSVGIKSFRMDLSCLKSIPENAFKGSAIKNINLGEINSIGQEAFTGCNALVSVQIEKAVSIPGNCFKDCNSLNTVEIYGLTVIPSSAFAGCTKLSAVNLPDVRLVLQKAFENCSSLQSVSLPGAISVFSDVFVGCNSLISLDLPSMQSFDDMMLSHNDYPHFPESLETFSAPSLKYTVKDMFKSAPNISIISLNEAVDIAEYTFRGCEKIQYLNLESANILKENSMSGCSAEFIDLRKLITAKSLPDNSGIMLSNLFIEATASAVNLTIYGTPDTFVERYANYKGYNFVPIPIILNDIPNNITSESEMIYVSAAGFNLEYQWYKNTENSTENGTPIEGAVNPSYMFTENDSSPFYYCVITQNDLGIKSTVKTHVIEKDTTPADYTYYNEAVAAASKVNRERYIDTSILDFVLSKNVYGKYACEQSVVDAQAKAIFDAIDNLEPNNAKQLYLISPKNELLLFEETKLKTLILPENCVYDNVIWSSSNRNAYVVNDEGVVRCVGSGKAVITATVINYDGAEISESIAFEGYLKPLGTLFSFLFKWIFVLISEIPARLF